MTVRKRRGPRCPQTWKWTSLDTVAETVPGVTDEMYQTLWAEMVRDERNPEEDWGLSDWKSDDPNRLEIAWRRLPIDLKDQLIPLLKAEDERRGR